MKSKVQSYISLDLWFCIGKSCVYWPLLKVCISINQGSWSHLAAILHRYVFSEAGYGQSSCLIACCQIKGNARILKWNQVNEVSRFVHTSNCSLLASPVAGGGMKDTAIYNVTTRCCRFFSKISIFQTLDLQERVTRRWYKFYESPFISRDTT